MNHKNNCFFSVIQIFFAIFLTLVLATWQSEWVFSFLFGEHSSQVGTVVNSIILVVFVVGIVHCLITLLRLHRQEKANHDFAKNLASQSDDPFMNVDFDTMIGKRYHIMKTLAEQDSPLPIGSLNHLLRSDLARYLSLPKYISSILILLGMLGTILSLGVALMGASDLIKSIDNFTDMATVINGMSTALSTTMTAIVCYILFRFSLGKVQNGVQLISRDIEHLSSIYLVPRFSAATKDIPQELQSLLVKLQNLTDQLGATQRTLLEQQQQIERRLQQSDGSQNIQDMIAHLDQINHSLKAGFRIE